MKVLQIINSLNTGGAEKLIVDGLPYYLEEDIEVDLLVLQESKSIFGKEIKNKFKGNIKYLSKGSLYNPLLIFKLVKIFKEYDVVHLHLFPTLYWGVLAKFLANIKVAIVYTEHSTRNRRRSNKLFQVCDKFVYSKLNYIGCISQACYINLIKHLNYKKRNIKVINNGINLKAFDTNTSINREFFQEDDFILIQISSFRKQKDQKTVIRALSLLPADIKLLLVGDGSLREECESLVKKLDLSNRVIFTGNRSDVVDLLKSSDLAIQSSEYEGFGLTAVEAMAIGKAVIASDVEGLNDVVRNYGVLFPKGNFEVLADEILKLYSDSVYKNTLELQCKSRSNDFDIIKMVKEYIDIYKEVVYVS